MPVKSVPDTNLGLAISLLKHKSCLNPVFFHEVFKGLVTWRGDQMTSEKNLQSPELWLECTKYTPVLFTF